MRSYVYLVKRRVQSCRRMQELRRERSEYVEKDYLQIHLENAVFKQREFDAVGCNCKDLRAHISSQFTGNMGWHNSHEWHIGFVVPRAVYVGDDQLRAFHYLNLKPVWGKFGHSLVHGVK